MPLPPTSAPDRDNPDPGGTTVRERGDACPGALRLHAADDGALARVRVPAGLLTARQAHVLADAAEELGDGRLDITSRGNLQLRGLTSGCGGELAARLRRAGLLPSDRNERIRNVAASPLCGLDGPAAADVQAWARELDALLCGAGGGADDDPGSGPGGDADGLPDGRVDLSALSGRFLFGLDDGRGDIVALGPDVTLIADEDGRDGQALLYLATGSPALRVAGRHAARAAALAAREFLAALDEHGVTAWRVRELAPERRPRPDRLAARLAAAGIPCEVVADATPPTGPPAEPGLVHGPGGRYALSVAAPLGRLTGDRWRLLARTAERDGGGELRVTPWRGVVIPGLTAPVAAARLADLADAGLVTSAASAWHRAGACAGRGGCAKSLADVRADAAACLSGARPDGTTPLLPVYWSGCERRCGHPADGHWVDVLATGDGYRVTVRDGAADTEAAAAAAAAAGPAPGPHDLADAVADAVSAARRTTPRPTT
ncbi:cobalamin biosynthesis protein CobG [Streptomyces sp. NPDC053048]|uniref:cobalamin biosynthesis protein CobG n=1 Tax=Streptomyces sp. NPDC053048 TaxID=3365694 RepID=UPI0037D24603